MLSNCGFDFLCCMLGGFELFITSVWVQLHAGRFSASRGSCTQFLCCTLGGFELFITSVGVQLHAGRFSASRASRGSCTQFLCCMLGGFELLLHPLKSQLHAGRFSTSLASSHCSKRFKIVRRPRMSVRWDQSSKSKPNNSHFNNNHFNNNHFNINHFNKNQFNNNHFNTDLLTNTESEYDEYDLVSRSLLGWKFVDLTALLSRQMLKKFNIELNHC